MPEQLISNNCPFDVTPYDTSSLVKTPNLVSVNYTNQDFWSMKNRLIAYVKEQFADSFNDFVESDLAIMLIENWAFIADTLSFKIDQIANEIFIDTVTEVDNLFRLSLLVGFKPQPPIGARSFWSASISNVLATDLIIPTPVAVSVNTEDGTRTIELFPADAGNNPMFNQDIVITTGNSINTNIIGVEGVTITQSALGTGAINQFVSLGDGPVIANSIQVAIDGTTWQQVDYFTDSQPRKEFRVEYDASYFAFVIFGNNRAGMIPSDGSQMQITYRVGGGVAGNIVTGSTSYQTNFIVPGFDFRVPVTFTNYTKGEFGYAGDGLDDIKRKIPPYLRSQNRAVSGSDYETLADQFTTDFFGQVGKAKAILRQYGCAANIIDLYILALDGVDSLATATNELKNALQAELTDKKMITDFVCVKDGIVLDVDVSVDLTLDRFYRKFENEIMAKIQSRVSAFFALNNWDYGKILKAADLIKSVSDVKEIQTFDVTLTTADPNNSGDVVVPQYFEIIRPGVIEINFVYQ